ncbi:hypothetical protein Trydic_g23376 [Trypoxylus dichotomus]
MPGNVQNIQKCKLDYVPGLELNDLDMLQKLVAKNYLAIMQQSNPFSETLREKIKCFGLASTQIYNADWAALHWKLLPDKTVVHSGEEQAPGRKTFKERLTCLVCAKRDGSHKLKPSVIG